MNDHNESEGKPDHTPANDDTPKLLSNLGGQEGIGRWVHRFYGRVPADSVLAPLFPSNLTESREKQFAFFVEFFGGPRLYTEKYGKAFLRFKHRRVKIGRPERDAWMELMLETLAEDITDPELLEQVERRLGGIADHMINHHPDKKDAYHFN